jgi:CBS domain-containing protein
MDLVQRACGTSRKQIENPHATDGRRLASSTFSLSTEGGRSMAKCSDVMTREPASCEPGDAIVSVAEVMKREDVGAVPVVESKSSRRVVGIITDRDIVVKVVAAGRAPQSATVRDAMTSNPATCQEDADVHEAVAGMAARQVRRMPVVDSQGRLCGIIAQADIATRVNKDKTTGELVEAISERGTIRK